MAFLLNVKYETTSPKSSQVIIDSLKIVAQYQLDRNLGQTITYHFARHDPDNKPTLFEFTEIYADEAIFFEHIMGGNCTGAIMNTYNDEYRKKQETIAIGDFSGSKMTKHTLDQSLKAVYPKYSGFVLNGMMFGKAKTKSPQEPIMIKLRLKATEDLEDLEKLVSGVFLANPNPGVITLLVYIHDGMVSVIQTGFSVSDLDFHWGSLDFTFLSKCASSTLSVYGNSVETFKKTIENLKFTTTEYVKTEVGYVLHPEACVTKKKESVVYDDWVKWAVPTSGMIDYVGSFVPKMKRVPSYEKEYFLQIRNWIEIQGVDINKKDRYDRNLLSYAVESNFLNCIKYLLDKKCSTECESYSPLCSAAQNYSVDTIKILVEAGAKLDGRDYQGSTPFHWICRSGKDDETTLGLFELFYKNGLDVNIFDKEGDTLLHLATRYGHVWLTRAILKKGARIDIKNQFGNSVLLNCCENTWGWNMSCFRLIYQKGGKKTLNERNEDGNGPLHLAAKNGLISLTRFLASNVKVDDLNVLGNTALMEACLNNRNVSVIQHLISYGASLNIQNLAGLTPLQLSLVNYNLDVVYVLLSRLNRVKMVDSIKDLVPQLEDVVEDMTKKKIDLDKVEKDDIQQ